MPPTKIIWTKIDEAPALATYSLLPIVQAYARGSGIEFETRDISLAGRIIANFPDRLSEQQRIPDDLTWLGELAKTPVANIVKLPNISASIPQLQAALKELRSHGYDMPDYPEDPQTEADLEVRARFAKVLGSAVNPVLREGNSDRRAAGSVKRFAREHPHKMMKPWPDTGSKTRVAHMEEKDFFGSETSATVRESEDVRIEFVSPGGTVSVLKATVALTAGEVIDTAVMNVTALRAFFSRTIEDAIRHKALLSLHLKATMMKVSDPIMFGHCVAVYYEHALEEHAEILDQIGADVNNGVAGILEKLDKLDSGKSGKVKAAFEAVYDNRPALAMVDSAKGISNLHVPNNVIIDASMPNVVRDGGKMWNRQGKLQDTIAMIPDRCYAAMYQTVIEDCQQHGQFDPSTMGSVSNVGLMARKAEEYGSHDKTFIAPGPGVIRVVGADGSTRLEQVVETGDIFRMCQTKDEPIRDWVRLAVDRARTSDTPAVFWLDEQRAHDAEIITKVKLYLCEHDTSDLDVQILKPIDAMRFALDRIRRGEDTIAVTGNVLRDYLTDLFPILELGTSARMLSIVPLLSGGGLFETGAGGSAPKHVEQMLKEGHLRWDSLGEYCALVPALELAATRTSNQRASVLAKTLERAIGLYLAEDRLPSRDVNEMDNRGSTFYLALYWAKALAKQNEDTELQSRFLVVAEKLEKNEAVIAKELLEAQGQPVDIGGYYHPDDTLAERVMRPSMTFNAIIDAA